jgi:hypothetical protein
MKTVFDIRPIHPEAAQAASVLPYRFTLADNGGRTDWTPALARTLMR